MALMCEESVRKRLADGAEFAGFLHRLLHPSFVSPGPSGVADLKEKQWSNRVQPFVQEWKRGITTCCAAEGDSSACISKTAGLYFDICHCQVWIEVPGGGATLNRMTK